MKLSITQQEQYSRAELLSRTFFGFFYMTLPHVFLMAFFGIWSGILSFISFWVILFTGRYPESFFEFQVAMLKWGIRLSARRYNLVDGYPAFFTSGEDTLTQLNIEYPENLSRGNLLLKTFLGAIYCYIPHAFVLMFRMFWGSILSIVAWWSVLFTGRYPESIHAFNVGTIRWSTRLSLYQKNMTDDYPPFSGLEISDEEPMLPLEEEQAVLV
jgi:hypothetical protein